MTRRPQRSDVKRALRDLELLWRPPPGKENAPAGTEARGEKLEDSRILTFPRRSCASCGILFIPRLPRHTRCLRCYAWALHARRVAGAVRAIRGRA